MTTDLTPVSAITIAIDCAEAALAAGAPRRALEPSEVIGRDHYETLDRRLGRLATCDELMQFRHVFSTRLSRITETSVIDLAIACAEAALANHAARPLTDAEPADYEALDRVLGRRATTEELWHFRRTFSAVLARADSSLECEEDC